MPKSLETYFAELYCKEKNIKPEYCHVFVEKIKYTHWWLLPKIRVKYKIKGQRVQNRYLMLGDAINLMLMHKYIFEENPNAYISDLQKKKKGIRILE